MSKTRVNKGEIYWYLYLWGAFPRVTPDKEGLNPPLDAERFAYGNYFATQEEAGQMARKLRAVLKGADVIEMPSEEEISEESNSSAHKMDIDDGETPNSGLYWRGWWDAVRWLKSKIVK